MKSPSSNKECSSLLGRVTAGYAHQRLANIGGSYLTFTDIVTSQEQYIAASSVLTRTPAVFHEFFVRECMRTQPVQQASNRLMYDVSSVAGKAKKTGGLSALAAFMEDRGRMHTVFHDLYLLLSGAGAVRADSPHPGLWDCALRGAMQKDPAVLTKLKCSGDPVRSVLTALSIMGKLSFSTKDVKQEREQEQKQNKDSDNDREREQLDDHEDTAQQDPKHDSAPDQKEVADNEQDTGESNTAFADDQGTSEQPDGSEASGDSDEDKTQDSSDADDGDPDDGSSNEAEEVDSSVLSSDALFAAVSKSQRADPACVLSEFQGIAGELAGVQSHEHCVADIASLLAALEILETKANNRYLEGVVQALGRVESIVNDALSVNVHGDGDILDVQQDDDPSRMLASEYANLACPELEYTFLSRLADHALLTSERRGVGESGMGPFAVLLDKSGSMAATLEDGTTLSSFTGAFAVQLFRMARQWQRPAMMYAFDSSLMGPSVVFSPIRQQSKSMFVQQLMTVAGISPTGGTNFAQALRGVAIKLKKDAPHNAVDLDKADVLILSDGCSELSADSHVASVRELFAPGTRFFGLFFVAGQQSAEQLEYLEKQNSSLLDLCVATTCDDDSLRKNCGRFFTEVLKRSFYEDSLV